ncbi:MAG: DNA ligase [Proteobacteria bacterium]|jgi:DNA ligase-1|nr:DNA ligase [Pseudomonadota bacterium]MBT5794730.1 DNA ligase [Deltaproteobacteria bacterium]
MSQKLFPLKILFYLFVSVLIFATTQLVAVDVSQNEHKIKPLLAKVYRQEDVSQWMVSEKLDGVRGIWNGEKLHFRSGKLIHAPKWFTENFPPQPMDGELWMGRGTFDRLSGIVRKKIPDERDWKQVRYMLFELPESSGTFTERIQKMVELTASVKIPWLQAIPQIHLDSEEALLKMLDEIVKKGGEGLMLHRADSLYHSGRSDDLLKLKPWQDAEATVIEILPGKGKFSGMMGALLLKDKSGHIFRIGTGFSDSERRNPPPPGSVITYKFTGTSKKGLPRFASFLRMYQQ